MYKEIINKFNDWVSKQDKPISVKEGQIKLIEISKKEMFDDLMNYPYIDNPDYLTIERIKQLKKRHLSTLPKGKAT